MDKAVVWCHYLNYYNNRHIIIINEFHRAASLTKTSGPLNRQSLNDADDRAAGAEISQISYSAVRKFTL